MGCKCCSDVYVLIVDGPDGSYLAASVFTSVGHAKEYAKIWPALRFKIYKVNDQETRLASTGNPAPPSPPSHSWDDRPWLTK